MSESMSQFILPTVLTLVSIYCGVILEKIFSINRSMNNLKKIKEMMKQEKPLEEVFIFLISKI